MARGYWNGKIVLLGFLDQVNSLPQDSEEILRPYMLFIH